METGGEQVVHFISNLAESVRDYPAKKIEIALYVRTLDRAPTG